METNEGPLIQRRIGLRFVFQLESEGFNYSLQDSSGQRMFYVPYEAINLEQPAFLVLRSTPLKKRLSALVIFFALLTIVSITINTVLAILFAVAEFLLITILFTGHITGWSAIRFKLFELQPLPPGALGPLRIIDDKTGEKVIQQISEARKEKFRKCYAQADLTADPAGEIARIKWLRSIEIITAEECEAQIERVNSSVSGHTDQTDTTPDSIH